MRLDWLRPVTELEGPFASVTLDVSNVDPATRDQRLKSWGSARRRLEDQGAPEDTIAALEEILTAEHHRPGPRTRVACASKDQVVVDVCFPGRPKAESASFGPVARVMDVVRGLDAAERYAVVRLDREGADVDVVDPTGEVLASRAVEGEHDELRKVGVGGSSQRRFQARAEDSWKHNAVQVAKALDQLIGREAPAIVFLEGEEHMISHVLEHASGPLAERVIRLGAGGRADGVSADAEAQAREVALARIHADRDAALTERWGDAKGNGGAVEGWGPVREALDGARVAHVLVQADGPALAPDAEQPDGCDLDVLLAQLAETAGELSVVGPPFEAREGIAAILRWTDGSTAR